MKTISKQRHPNCLKNPEKRSGSILLVVAGTLFCLFLFALGYSRFLSRQSAMADKMSKKQKMSGIARALATLTTHKLQFSGQLTPGSADGTAMPHKSPALKALFTYLSQPLAAFESSKSFAMPLDEEETAHFSLLIQGLWQDAGYGDSLVEEISLVVNKADLTTSGPAPDSYTREKSGNLLLVVNLKIKNDDKIYSSVDFNFACPVRISTIHVPVLAKYNLYIGDARMSAGEEETGYNQVSVNQFGNIETTRTTALPLVLNNDDNQNLPVKTDLRNFIEDRRGLVYLGGSSKIFLNLTRADFLAPNADSAEGFHFFRDNDGFDGFYPAYPGTSAKSGPVLVSFMDQGVSDDPDNRNASFYKRIISGHTGAKQVNDGRMNLASIFRLFGVQGKPSSTLVQGHVFSSFLTIARLTGLNGKAVTPPILDNLSYAAPMTPEPYFLDVITQPEYEDLRSAFALDASFNSFVKYITLLASQIRRRPYNQALGFLHTQNDADAYRMFAESDPLGQFVRSANHAGTHAVPGIFAGVYPSVPDIRNLSQLLSPSVSPARASYIFNNPGNADAISFLNDAGLLSNGALVLNGWARFKSGIKIDRPLEYLSSAGLVVEKGDIIVSAPLNPGPGRNNCLLYLIALDGNIIFDNNPGETVQAAVIADAAASDQGRVIFKRPPASLRGAMAMKKLTRNHEEAAAFKGTSLTYFAPLAALPASTDGASDDSTLLSFSFCQTPQELQ